MKKNRLFWPAICGLIIMSSCFSKKQSGMNDVVAFMEVDEPIKGLCDNSRVIVILPLPGNGQVKAKAPLTDQEIEDKLNAEVLFLKDKPEYNDEGMVNMIVNCLGDMVRCQIDNETSDPELDEQIVAVFAGLKSWKAATINGKPVDTLVLYSFKIENGKILLK